MLSTEALVWIVSGLMPVIGGLIAVIYNRMVSDDKKHEEAIQKHQEAIQKKADSDKLKDLEAKFKDELKDSKETNERLMDKIEQRYDKELSAMELRINASIKTSETNILAQMQSQMQIFSQMIDTLVKRKE